MKVSSTPGKTRYIQTIETDEFTLLDCPGLIFPKYSKIELTLMGVLNIDQITDLCKYEAEIVDLIGIEKIRSYYKIRNEGNDILELMGREKGWIKSRCLKTIVKDFSLGEIPYF